MLTEKEKVLLEEKIYGMMKTMLQEKDSRFNLVLKWLKNEQTNNASIARDLWPDMNEDTARSLFSKKLRGHDADGNSYSFTDTEISKLFNIKNKFISKL